MTVQNNDGNQLVQLLSNNGLKETPQGKQLLDQFSGYFDMAAEWETKAKAIVVTRADQTAEMAMARQGRLFLRQKRIDVENTRKALKERIVREGKAIDGIANVLKALIAPVEDYLRDQEEFVKREAERKAFEIREEYERKVREEQERQEKLDTIGRERELTAMPYRDYWSEDDPKFREMQQTEFQQFIKDCKARRQQALEEQERIRKENERLEIERKKAELRAQKEREKNERERKKAEEMARKEREEAERREREEKERHEAELRAQRDEAERIQREKDEAARKERERLEREKAEAEERARIDRERAEREKAEREAQLEAERQERARLDALAAGKLSACEAIYAFISGLLTRSESIKIGAKHEGTSLAELARDFCDAHGLGEPEEGWESKIIPMTEGTWRK